MNMHLTIYSKNFDDYEYVVNKGMSGKIFLENSKNGQQFSSIDNALKFCTDNGIELDGILYCYQKNGKQMFKQFEFPKNAK